MVKIIDVGQTKRAPGLYRGAKDYVIRERSMRILTPSNLTTGLSSCVAQLVASRNAAHGNPRRYECTETNFAKKLTDSHVRYKLIFVKKW